MKIKNNVIGKKYGKLIVLEEINSSVKSREKYRKTLLKLKCQCECGDILFPYKGNVLYGKTTQCKPCSHSHNSIGEKIGTLTLLSRMIKGKIRGHLCKCDCGFEDFYCNRFLQHGKKICCKKCKYPKKYGPQIKKKSRKECLEFIQYNKHIISKNSLIGKRIGNLKIIGFSHWEQKSDRRRACYLAKCKCGNKTIIRNCFLKKSCGCLQKKSVPKAEDNFHAKLNNKQVKAIIQFKKSNIGYTGRQIADMFHVSKHIISNILLGKTYKAVSEEK